MTPHELGIREIKFIPMAFAQKDTLSYLKRLELVGYLRRIFKRRCPVLNIFNGIIEHVHEISEQRGIQYFRVRTNPWSRKESGARKKSTRELYLGKLMKEMGNPVASEAEAYLETIHSLTQTTTNQMNWGQGLIQPIMR